MEDAKEAKNERQMVFAKRFRELRKAAGISQAEIGQLLGVSKGAISFYENGDRGVNIDFAVKAAEYFHVSCDWIMGREGAIKSFDVADDSDYQALYLVEKERRQMYENAFHSLWESLRATVDRVAMIKRDR